MLTVYDSQPGTLRRSAITVEPGTGGRAQGGNQRAMAGAVWADLMEPTLEERRAVEAAFGLQLPTREESQEIEDSSRLYAEDGALHMTATVLAFADSDYPQTAAVTFILSSRGLVTLRYAEPRAFRQFVLQAERQAGLAETPESTLLNLLDAFLARIADVLEMASAENDALSHEVLAQPGQSLHAGSARGYRGANGGGHGHGGGAGATGPGALGELHPGGHGRRAQEQVTKLAQIDFEAMLRRLGRTQAMVAKTRESLLSLNRLMSFLARPAVGGPVLSRTGREELHSLIQDMRSLTEHTGYLSANISFELDAILGMLNAEQNSIIKIFTVASVIFLPPTLIASLYGMNFAHMPELNWRLGYPFAILLMIVSVVTPLAWFRRRGWI